MATGPTLPTDPIEILTPDLSREEPYFNKVWAPGVAVVVTWSSAALASYCLHKPWLTRLPLQAALVLGSGLAGYLLDESRKKYYAETDAVLRHYVQLHPEDFPAAVPQKYADLFLPWHPIR